MEKNIGYMNGLWLNKILKERDSWTAKDIEEKNRTNSRKGYKTFFIRLLKAKKSIY